ncbi:MAG: hypothetical protein Q7S92_04140 [Candidatus Diapherotrites archaeon]|nr:hypothetical protein [Candidatus Diapherotrites archaeon]
MKPNLRLVKPKPIGRPSRKTRKTLKRAAVASKALIHQEAAEAYRDLIQERFTPKVLRALVAEGFLKFGKDKPGQRPMSVLEQAVRMQGHVMEQILERMNLPDGKKHKAIRLQRQLTFLVSPIHRVQVGELKTILGISESLIKTYGVPKKMFESEQDDILRLFQRGLLKDNFLRLIKKRLHGLNGRQYPSSKIIPFTENDRAIRDIAVEWLSLRFNAALFPHDQLALEIRSRTDNLITRHLKRNASKPK